MNFIAQFTLRTYRIGNISEVVSTLETAKAKYAVVFTTSRPKVPKVGWATVDARVRDSSR